MDFCSGTDLVFRATFFCGLHCSDAVSVLVDFHSDAMVENAMVGRLLRGSDLFSKHTFPGRRVFTQIGQSFFALAQKKNAEFNAVFIHIDDRGGEGEQGFGHQIPVRLIFLIFTK